MNEKLYKLLRDLRESYWFVPTIMVSLAVLLAFVSGRIDAAYSTKFLSGIGWLYQSEPDGARAVLSAIATSMIGVAGVTFSMTIVAVSFATANLGPRLMANFMRDRGNQVTLGTFIATFVYCLLTLRTVTDARDGDIAANVPDISILFALVLTLASIGVLIYFIHHIPESINVSRITAGIGEMLYQRVEDLFPAALDPSAPDDMDSRSHAPSFESAAVLHCDASGYLQAIDQARLRELAIEHDLIIRVEYRPGDFLVDSAQIVRVQGNVDDDVACQLRNCFVLGHERTAAQDALFLVDQLVEILARALSPGINDPFTAVTCMDWLRRALDRAVNSEAPTPYWFDEAGGLRVVARPVTFFTLSDAVFMQSLQYVAADRIAAGHMMHTLGELIAVARSTSVRHHLLGHARDLHDAAQTSLAIESSCRELAQRYESLQRIAVDPAFLAAQKNTGDWIGGRG